MRRILSLVAAVSLAGAACVSTPGPSVYEMFADADERWALVVDGGFAETRSFGVPQGAAHVLVRTSFKSDQGIRFFIEGPPGRIGTSQSFQRAAEARHMEWVEEAAPRPGTRSLHVACPWHCQFAFGFYFHAEPTESTTLDGRHREVAKRFDGSSAGGGVVVHDFVVPPGSEQLTVEWSLAAARKFEATLRDPSGASRFSFKLPSQPRVDEARYDAVVGPDPGAWAVAVTCQAQCRYVIGLDY